MKILTLLFLFLIASGCTNQSAIKPNPDLEVSAIEIISKYREASTAGLFDPYAFDDGITEHKKYKNIKKWWCLDNNSSKNELKSTLSSFCNSKNGFQRDDWCANKENGDPIFYVKFNTRMNKCHGKKTIHVTAFESYSNSNNKEWINFSIKNLGHKQQSERDIYNKNVQESIAFKNRVESNRQAKKADSKRKKYYQKSMLDNIKIGTETNCGMVIQVRESLLEVQTTIGNKWFKGENLYPPGMETCSL